MRLRLHPGLQVSNFGNCCRLKYSREITYPRSSDEIDAKNVAARGAFLVRPPRMTPGIATDEYSVMVFQPMRVAGTGNKLGRLQNLAS